MLAPGVIMAFLMGGNRSGKSDGMAQAHTAYALGREHEHAVAWARLNQIPIEWIPRGPGHAWAVAGDSGDSIDYVRPKYARYAPAGSSWKNRDGNGQAKLTYPNGGTVTFKSVDQGRDGFQGAGIRSIHFDEEPKDLGVVKEAQMRIVDQRGRLFFSMTSLMGWTDLLTEYVEKPAQSTVVTYIHSKDNPHIPADFLEEILSGYGEHERASRETGAIMVLEGLVYPFRRAKHVIRARELPPEWTRIRAIDFGTRNPFCCLWMAIDPDGVVHVYREHYQREWTIAQHVRQIRAMSGDEVYDLTVADPEDRGARITMAQQYDMVTVPALKDIRRGVNAVSERMSDDAEGEPGLLIHDCCSHTIREMEGYIWSPQHSKVNGRPDRPAKRNDHAMDALRYGVMGISINLAL